MIVGFVIGALVGALLGALCVVATSRWTYMRNGDVRRAR